MDQQKWFNQMQPQTLQFACILLYLNAVFGLFYFLGGAVFEIISMVGAAGAFGIANDKKWGWYLALGVAVLNTLLVLIYPLGFYALISLMFRVLLIVLLLHPMTRSYQKLWFK